MKNSREAILDRVKAAVKQPVHRGAMPADAEQKVAAGLKAATPAGQQGLAEQFKAEIEKISGECHLISSEAGITPLLMNMLGEIQCTKLALDSHSMSRKIGQALQQKMPQLDCIDAMTQDYDARRIRLAGAPAGLVTADYGIADAATLIVLYDQQQSNMAHFLPETIFTLLPINKLAPNLFDALAKIDREKGKNMVLITGPSRTADI
ncbi:LUD domain-containing protein, partial [candidate division KSB1 bacterium]|nr:LUD domain-containing protein [candidate division KSB1 bacterium]